MAMTFLDRFPEEGFDLNPLAPGVGPFPAGRDSWRPGGRRSDPRPGCWSCRAERESLPLMESAGRDSIPGGQRPHRLSQPPRHGRRRSGGDPRDADRSRRSHWTSIRFPGEAAVAFAREPVADRASSQDVGADHCQGAGVAVFDRRVLHDDRQEGAPRTATKATALRGAGRTGDSCVPTMGAGFGFDEFVRLHRLAPGDKGTFMTGERHRSFHAWPARKGGGSIISRMVAPPLPASSAGPMGPTTTCTTRASTRRSRPPRRGWCC